MVDSLSNLGKVPSLDELHVIISSLFYVIKDVKLDTDKNTDKATDAVIHKVIDHVNKKEDFPNEELTNEENNHEKLDELQSNVENNVNNPNTDNESSSLPKNNENKHASSDSQDSLPINILTSRELYFSSELKKVRLMKKFLSLISLFFKSSSVSIHESRSMFVHFLTQCIVNHTSHISGNFFIWNYVIEVMNSILLNWKKDDYKLIENQKEIQENQTIINCNSNSITNNEDHDINNSNEIHEDFISKRLNESLDTKDILSFDSNLQFYTNDASFLFSSETMKEQINFIESILSDNFKFLETWNTMKHRYSVTHSIIEYHNRLWVYLKSTISDISTQESMFIQDTSYQNRVFFHCLKGDLDCILDSLIEIILSLCAKENAEKIDNFEFANMRDICLRNVLILLFSIQHFFDLSSFVYSFYIELSMFKCIDIFVQWISSHLDFDSVTCTDEKISCAIIMGRILLRLIENHSLALSWFVKCDGTKIFRSKIARSKNEQLTIVFSSLYRYSKRYSESLSEIQTRRVVNIVGTVYRLSHLSLRFSPDTWLQNDNLPEERLMQLLCEKQLKDITHFLENQELEFESKNELFIPASDALNSDSDSEEFELWGIEKLKINS